MFLHLEKLLVKREHFGGTSGARRRKAACGVRQNLLQMTGRSHHKFGLLFNLKLDRQNPNLSQMEKTRSACLCQDIMSCRGSVFQKPNNRRRIKLLTAMKEFQLNQKLCFEQLSAGFANEDCRSSGSSASRQQIIYQHNLFACVDGIDVHLHFRFAVLERVTGNLSLERELATLSNRNETDTELIGDR